MVRTSLPPGFRFHPTDVELILYYLKRKINGSKLHYEAIGEVNIYRHSPWDLPDKSLLKTMDLEWFFFCPREKKYASGVRVKRATENGFWKTTGRDRIISYNGKTVGTVKTLIFYLGHAPKGERTDWVIHEYKILDDQLAKAGLQDNFVLCKVFKKNGLGPKNGAQYGAPFNEADWDDDDDDAQNCGIPSTDDGPCSILLMRNEEQHLPLGGSAKGDPVPEEGPSSSVAVPTSMVAADETTECDGPFPTVLMQNEEQCFPLATGFFGSGNVLPPGTGLFGSGNGSLPIPDEGPSTSAVVPTSKGVVDETSEHEMAHLLGLFTDEDILLVNGNGPNKDDLINGNGDEGFLPSLEVDLYDGLDDLDISTGMRENNFDYSLTSILPQDNSMYIELDDLLPPLDSTNGVSGTHLSSLGLASASSNHENMQQLYSGTGFAGLNQYNTFPEYGWVASPYTSDFGDSLVALQMLDHQINRGPNASYNLHLPSGQLENAVYTPHDMMERGSHLENRYSRYMECIPAHLPTAAELLARAVSTCGGSSIHIKAEVTHGAGECTNEALSVMMEGSGSCWSNLLLLHLCVVEVSLNLVRYSILVFLLQCDCFAELSLLLHEGKLIIFTPTTKTGNIYLAFSESH